MKITIEAKKYWRRPNRAANHGLSGITTTLAMRYAVTTHAPRSTPTPKLPWMFGSETLTIVTSMISSSVAVMTATLMMTRRHPCSTTGLS